MTSSSTERPDEAIAPEGGRLLTPPGARAALGFWSGVMTAVCAVGFLVGNLAFPTPAWQGMTAYITQFDSLQMLWIIPALLLAPSFLILMVCIRDSAAKSKRLFADAGVAFTTVYVALASVNYLVQILVVWPGLLRGEAQGLTFLSMANPRSLFFALEGPSYLFQEIGIIFAALVFVAPGIQRLIRWSLFGAGFGCWPIAALLVLVLPKAVLSALGPMGVVSVGTDLWAIFLAVSGGLLAAYFRRAAPIPGPT